MKCNKANKSFGNEKQIKFVPTLLTNFNLKGFSLKVL